MRLLRLQQRCNPFLRQNSGWFSHCRSFAAAVRASLPLFEPSNQLVACALTLASRPNRNTSFARQQSTLRAS